MNITILSGRLTKDAELRYTPGGQAVATFTLAVDRVFKKEGQQDVDFIPCVQWGKGAENTAQYTEKGSLVAVEGRLQVRTYDNKEGKKVWATEVVCERVEFLSRKKTEQTAGQSFGKEVEFDAESIPF